MRSLYKKISSFWFKFYLYLLLEKWLCWATSFGIILSGIRSFILEDQNWFVFSPVKTSKSYIYFSKIIIGWMKNWSSKLTIGRCLCWREVCPTFAKFSCSKSVRVSKFQLILEELNYFTWKWLTKWLTSSHMHVGLMWIKKSKKKVDPTHFEDRSSPLTTIRSL